MDLKGKLAGQSGANTNNNNNTKNQENGGGSGNNRRGGGRGNEQGQKNQKDQVKMPSRLEGRVTFPGKQNEDKEGKRGGKDGKGGNHGNSGRGNQKEGHSEKKTSVSF